MKKKRAGNCGVIGDFFSDVAFVVQIIGEFVVEFVVDIIC